MSEVEPTDMNSSDDDSQPTGKGVNLAKKTWKICSPASAILASIVTILLRFKQFWR